MNPGKVLKFIIIFVVPLVSLAIFSYFGNVVCIQKNIPSKNTKIEEIKKQLEKETQHDKKIKSKLLTNCINEVEQEYITRWNSECAQLGNSEGCDLPDKIAERLDSMTNKNREHCFKSLPSLDP